MKADVYGYPQNWKYRFIKGVGEELPFADQTFDFVSSYQTLEHVQDVRRCLQEMLRVLRPGGAMFLRSPDYRSIFEGHYRLPWLPLFPRSLARLYLRALSRPEIGLSTLNYITTPSIKRMLRNEKVKIIDLDRQNTRYTFREGLRLSWLREGDISRFLWFLRRGMVSLVRLVVAITLIVVKEA
jgi:ubiquinone/menaquinone biosynthesis C-methylase UbiE